MTIKKNNKPRELDKIFDNNGKAIICVFVGKSFRGKSYFLRYLLIDRLSSGKFKFGLVFTTTKFVGDYKFIPDNRIIEGYNEDILKKYFDNLKKIKIKNGDVPPNFIVFDDLLGVLCNETGWFTNFIATVRHLNCSVFVAVQYCSKKGISPTMRAQTTHAIMYRSNMKNTTQTLYDSYGGMFETMKDFKQHYDNVTKEKYIGMCYLENDEYDDIKKNYFGIRAPAEYNDEVTFSF